MTATYLLEELAEITALHHNEELIGGVKSMA
jgi:hypothetical protein